MRRGSRVRLGIWSGTVARAEGGQVTVDWDERIGWDEENDRQSTVPADWLKRED